MKGKIRSFKISSIETAFHKLFLLPALLVHCGVWSLQAKRIGQSLWSRTSFILWGAYGMCQTYGIDIPL